METAQFLFVILIVLITSVAFIIWYIKSQVTSLNNNQNDPVLMAWLKDMRNSMENQSRVLNTHLKDQNINLTEQLSKQREAMNNQTKLIWERLDNASDVIQNVQKHLGGIQEFGKDLKDLSNVLKSPKLRGSLGEQFLYEILSNCLPKDLYRTQYKFRNGSICDAVILTEGGIIPVDSKFSMENFKGMVEADSDEARDSYKKAFIKDVKKRIDEINYKYIVPEEGTTDQAIMYIPSESVYYEIIVNTTDIENYAKSKNVVMASPNTFSYLMKVILIGYQKHEFDKHASQVLQAISGIKVEAEKFNNELGVLDGHIARAVNSMNSIKSGYQRLFSKITDANTIEAKVEQPLLQGDGLYVNKL